MDRKTGSVESPEVKSGLRLGTLFFFISGSFALYTYILGCPVSKRAGRVLRKKLELEAMGCLILVPEKLMNDIFTGKMCFECF